jgi:hypothetical protein
LRLVIDAAETPLAPALALFPAQGEYARTIAVLARERRLLARLPDRVLLSLYATELAERLRERARAETAAASGTEGLLVAAPFWPALLFHAADEPIHPAREVELLWPRIESVTFVERDVGTLRTAAQRILGGERFDPERYRAGALELTRAGRFERVVP